jgi:transcriptional regulator with XRE-family HTH domain
MIDFFVALAKLFRESGRVRLLLEERRKKGRLIGENVRRIRQSRGLTQEQLAKRSGYSQRYISGLEEGRRNPTVVPQFALARALGVSHLELVQPRVASERAGLLATAPETSVSEAPPPRAAASAETAVAEAIAAGAEREVGSEIVLRIMGLGERRYAGSGWAGTPGSRQPIEALTIRPAETLPRNAVEFRVIARNGRATSGVTDGNYAGTSGRRLPLTGFAVRPTEGHGSGVEIVYQGYFPEGGAVGPKRDGEVCQSTIADDPLEAVLVRILERAVRDTLEKGEP